MEKRSVSCLVGTGGWEHEDFDGCLYPRRKAESAEKLMYYAQFFDTVEVRPTFWDDSLSANEAKKWVDAVASNKRFLFCVKLHASFTHQYRIDLDLTKSIRGLLQELGKHDRLGALLAQFPYAFTNTSANRFHLVKLGELFRGFPVHIELRHESWDQPTLLNFLEENHLRPVTADLPRIRHYMRPVMRVIDETAYLRLHGRNEKGWLLNGVDTRYDYLYNSREIREIVRRVNLLSNKCSRIIVICNNTTAGKAVANALQLTSALREGKPVLAPDAALREFPDLRDIGVLVQERNSLLGSQSYKQAM